MEKFLASRQCVIKIETWNNNKPFISFLFSSLSHQDIKCEIVKILEKKFLFWLFRVSVKLVLRGMKRNTTWLRSKKKLIKILFYKTNNWNFNKIYFYFINNLILIKIFIFIHATPFNISIAMLFSWENFLNIIFLMTTCLWVKFAKLKFFNRFTMKIFQPVTIGTFPLI
jgi:hypothetical protein